MSRYIVGIDLGTTNIAVSYFDTAQPDSGISSFPIEQWVGQGQKQAKAQLPAYRYQLLENEFPSGSVEISGVHDIGDGAVVGEWAKELGAKSKGRLIKSPKSWLAYCRPDEEALLPETCQVDALKRSAYAVQTDFIAYLCARWNEAFPEHLLKDQSVCLTIPASFSPHARAQTLSACEALALNVELIEEPSAAFIYWAYLNKASIPTELEVGETILVCDVGGGTTDFTLIKVDAIEPDIKFTRVAVGEHLLLGGDNIDMALALRLANAFDAPISMRHPEFDQLILACQQAKERLLEDESLTEVSVVILTRGASMIGSQKRTVLTREMFEEVIAGFYPEAALETAQPKVTAGLQQRGLPYEKDPGITTHCAAFLNRYCNEETGLLLPSKVLFNGGSLLSESLQKRVISNLMLPYPLVCLDNQSLSLAVAHGACAQGLSQRGMAPSIQTQVTQNFHLVLGNGGSESEYHAVCVLHRGEHTNEFQHVALHDKKLQVQTGERVQFQVLKELTPKTRQLGEITDFSTKEVMLLPPLITTVDATSKKQTKLMCDLQARMTDIGLLELLLVGAEQQWKLAFELSDNQVMTEEPLKADIALLVQSVYKRKSDISPKQLKSSLEKMLGQSEQWPINICRTIADALIDVSERRRKSDVHERIWFQLLGFVMRPGKGWYGDSQRMALLAPIFHEDVQYKAEEANWRAFWVALRRVLAGSDAQMQMHWFEYIAPYFDQALQVKKNLLKSMQGRAVPEMIMVLGVMSKLDLSIRELILEELISQLSKPKAIANSWWIIANILDGSDDLALEKVLTWLNTLLDLATQPQHFSAILNIYALLDENDQEVGNKIIRAVKKHPIYLGYIEAALEMTPQVIRKAMKKDISESVPLGIAIL